VKNVWWGRSVHAIGHFGAILHHFGRKMALSQTCSNPANPAAFQDLCDDLMQNQIWGRGSGRWVMWVILSRPGMSANTGYAISQQPMHAFKPDQA